MMCWSKKKDKFVEEDQKRFCHAAQTFDSAKPSQNLRNSF